mmetsp:Transcript_25459/g.37902  ORF Transcript_25459/g.37902 Transcript_25459/m.37902 type:complete len:129 (-) Transcript_25459:1283-1669(-)
MKTHQKATNKSVARLFLHLNNNIVNKDIVLSVIALTLPSKFHVLNGILHANNEGFGYPFSVGKMYATHVASRFLPIVLVFLELYAKSIFVFVHSLPLKGEDELPIDASAASLLLVGHTSSCRDFLGGD